MKISVNDGQDKSFAVVMAAVVTSGLFTVVFTIVIIFLCHKRFYERPTVVQRDRIRMAHIGPYQLLDDEITVYDAMNRESRV